MSKPSADRSETAGVVVPPEAPIDPHPNEIDQDSNGMHNLQAVAEGTDIEQTINYHINYNTSNASAEAARPTLQFVPWRRGSTPYDGLDDEFVKKLQSVEGKIVRDHFVVIETRLSSFAEDAFQLILNARKHFGGALAAVPSFKASDNDVSLSSVLSDISKIEANSVCFFDLRSLPEEVRNRFQFDTESLDAFYLTQALKHTDTFCLMYSPAVPPSLKRSEYGGITFSDKDEERILIYRASVHHGEPDPLIVEALEQQIERSMWGEAHIDQMWALDESIRSRKVRLQVHELRKRVAQVDKESSEYFARLKYLLGYEDIEPFKKEQLRSVYRLWPEQVTRALVEQALLILTNFEGLMPTEFDLLMKKLLRGKSIVEQLHETELIPLELRHLSSHAQNPLMGLGDKIGENVVSLETAYSQAPDALLRLIDVHAQETGRLAFAPALKAQVGRVFRLNGSILMDKFLVEETVEQCLLFDESLYIAEQLADRYAERAIAVPSTRREDFISDWMDRSTRYFIETRIPSLEYLDRTGAATPLTLLLQALDAQRSRDKARELSKEYAERVSLFLLRLLSEPTTKTQVDQALHRLMIEGQGTEARYDIIWTFVRILRRHPEFRTLFWLKRLLAEGNEDAKKSALDFLARGIEQGRRDGEGEHRTLLGTLRAWLPRGVEYASRLNTQTAALLAPRVAVYRAFARISDQEHGRVDRLIPLFDMTREDGLSLDFLPTIELLTIAVDGPWIRDDLFLLNQLVGGRWQLDNNGKNSANGVPSNFPLVLTNFPALRALVEKRTSRPWTYADSRHLALTGLLVEIVATIVGSPEDANQRRLDVAERMLTQVARKSNELDRRSDSIRSLIERAYAFDRSLKPNRSAASERRGQCARWIGDTLFEWSKDGALDKQQSRGSHPFA